MIHSLATIHEGEVERPAEFLAIEKKKVKYKATRQSQVTQDQIPQY